MNLMDLMVTIAVADSASSKISAVGALAKGMAVAAGGMVLEFGKSVAGFVAGSIEAGTTFDAAMSQVAATIGTTNAALDSTTVSVGDFTGSLRDFVKHEGSTTAFTATQAAEALNYMALAGWDLQTSAAELPAVLSLAAAGNIDLASASDMVTDVSTALGLSLQETNKMIDEMAAASANSNTSVAAMGDAFLTVGGLAKFLTGAEVKLSDGTTQVMSTTQELSTVLGVLANNGIKGGEAATHLRNMILKLSSPTSEGAAMIKKLGLEVFDTSGNMRSMQDVFADLNVAMADFTSEQKIEAFSALFNTRDIAAANALLDTTAGEWNTLGAAIVESGGAAERMANTQLDNLKGSMTKFQSALEGAKLAISDALSPTLKKFVDMGTEGLQKVSDALSAGDIQGAWDAVKSTISEAGSLISKLAAPWQRQITMVKTLIAAVVAFKAAATFGAVIAAIMGVTSAAEGATTVLGVMQAIVAANPVGAIAVAIAAVAAAVTYLWNTSDSFRDGVMEAWSVVSDFMSDLWSTVSSVAVVAWRLISTTAINVWNTIKTAAITAWNAISNSLKPCIQAVKNTFSSGKEAIMAIWAVVGPFFQGLWSVIQDAAQVAWAYIQMVATIAWEAIKLGATALGASISGVFEMAWSVVKATWSVATGYFSAVWNTIAGIFSVVAAVLSGDFDAAWAAIQGIASTWASFFSGVWAAIISVFSNAMAVGTNVGQSISNGFSNALNDIVSKAQSIWNAIRDILSKPISGVINLITNGVGGKLPGHKNGLDYVPFDGYVAELHKGERVLTAEEAKRYNAGAGGSGSVVNVYAQSLSNAQVDYIVNAVNRKLGGAFA